MCGRYALYGPVSRLREVFDAVPEGFEFEPRWNAAPMQWLPVVRQRPTGERVIHRLRWGLVPSWAKDETIATKLINARGESVAEKALVPGGVPPPALPRAGQRLLRVAAAR
jgi:putative SOS response-associated peptidase YedK